MSLLSKFHAVGQKNAAMSFINTFKHSCPIAVIVVLKVIKDKLITVENNTNLFIIVIISILNPFDIESTE